jgi:multicomponent Na+:H+ antiporter subunit G
MRLVADIFLLMGALFMFLGALGLIRMPDVYSRIQAGTKAATLGALCFLISIALFFPVWWPKLLVIAGFIMFTNPVGSSTIARSVYISGTSPWMSRGATPQQCGKATAEEQT